MGETTWSEFEIINRFFRTIENPAHEGVIAGIGDDAAVITVNTPSTILATHDMMVENIHFKASWMSPSELAGKLVKVNVSDIAAMGGTPLYALLSLALPDSIESGWLDGFSEGLRTALKMYNVSLIGGDTSLSPGPVTVALTLLGKCASSPVMRHTPNPGDFLYVTGTLGDAALGLVILEKKGKNLRMDRDETALIQRHLNPMPRLKEGREIALKAIASSMIDISDGLLADLDHLLEDSTLGAEIIFESLPLSKAFRNTAFRYHDSPETLALSGGEDYELLFTSPLVPEEISTQLSFPLTTVGKITEKSGIIVHKNGSPLSLEVRGFQHRFHQKGS